MSEYIIKYGLYHELLSIFFKTFPQENIKIIILEEAKVNFQNSLNKLFNFLNLNHYEINDSIKPKNKSKMYKISYLARFSAFIRKMDILKQVLPKYLLRLLRKIFVFINKKNMKNWDYPKLPNKYKIKLAKLFKNDISQLEKYYPGISKIWNF